MDIKEDAMSKNRWLIGFLPLVALIVACGGIHHAVKYQDLDGHRPETVAHFPGLT